MKQYKYYNRHTNTPIRSLYGPIEGNWTLQYIAEWLSSTDWNGVLTEHNALNNFNGPVTADELYRIDSRIRVLE